MNIGFDAKRIFQNSTGLGNYSRDLVRNLANQYPENKYVLFGKPQKNKSLCAAVLVTLRHINSNIPKKNNPEAIAYLRLIPSSSASGLFFEKGNIISVIC